MRSLTAVVRQLFFRLFSASDQPEHSVPGLGVNDLLLGVGVLILQVLFLDISAQFALFPGYRLSAIGTVQHYERR